MRNDRTRGPTSDISLDLEFRHVPSSRSSAHRARPRRRRRRGWAAARAALCHPSSDRLPRPCPSPAGDRLVRASSELLSLESWGSPSPSSWPTLFLLHYGRGTPEGSLALSAERRGLASPLLLEGLSGGGSPSARDVAAGARRTSRGEGGERQPADQHRPAIPILVEMRSAKNPGTTPTVEGVDRFCRPHRVKLVGRTCVTRPMRYGTRRLRPPMSTADRFMSSAPQPLEAGQAEPKPIGDPECSGAEQLPELVTERGTDGPVRESEAA